MRTKEFALRAIRMCSKLSKIDTVAQVPGKQILRSGTSVGANYREASRSCSKAEFISKIGDGLKEIEETEYWLELLVDSVVVCLRRRWPVCSMKPASLSPFSPRLTKTPNETFSFQPLAFSFVL